MGITAGDEELSGWETFGVKNPVGRYEIMVSKSKPSGSLRLCM